MEGGARHFSSWKLNDAHNLTILVKGGRHFFKLQGGGGEAKSKPATESPEHVFMLLIAWSLKTGPDIFSHNKHSMTMSTIRITLLFHNVIQASRISRQAS